VEWAFTSRVFESPSKKRHKGGAGSESPAEVMFGYARARFGGRCAAAPPLGGGGGEMRGAGASGRRSGLDC
jgi:hypothetical protein